MEGHRYHKKNDQKIHVCDCQTINSLKMIDGIITSGNEEDNLIRQFAKSIQSISKSTPNDSITHRISKTLSKLKMESDAYNEDSLQSVEFSVKIFDTSGTPPNATFLNKTVEDNPFYKFIGGWRTLPIDGLSWLPSRYSGEFRFSMSKDCKMNRVTENFYKAIHSITNCYNPRLYSNVLQFPSLDDFESQFFGYATFMNENDTLETKLREVKSRHCGLTFEETELDPDEYISIAIIGPPPEHTDEDVNNFVRKNPINYNILKYLPNQWSQVEARAKQLVLEHLHFYSASFINKHFNTMRSEECQDMLFFGMEEISIEQAWFMLKNMNKYDLTRAQEFPEMFYIDHLERNWIALIRAAQLYTAECKFFEVQLTNTPSLLKKKNKKKAKRIKNREIMEELNNQCFQCCKLGDLFTFELCGHSYLCEECWQKYKRLFFEGEGVENWQKLKCLFCDSSIKIYC